MLERLSDADETAWEEFVSRFRGPIEGFARRLGQPSSAAEDIAQSTLLTFLNAFREGRYERDRGRLSSWLFGIAHNEVRKAARQRRRDNAIPAPAAQDDEHLAQVTWTEEWSRHVLDLCVRQIRGEVAASTFDAFELTAIRGTPPAEVANRLGMTRNAVYAAKHRVLERIDALRREFEHEAGRP